MSSGNGLKSWEKDENDPGYRPHGSERYDDENYERRYMTKPQTLSEQLSGFTDDQLQTELKRRKIEQQDKEERRIKAERYNAPILKRKAELEREVKQLERQLKKV